MPRLAVIVVAAICAAAFAQPTQPALLNQLTPAEKSAGWKLLFDGKTTNGWRGYKKPAFPAVGWKVADGCLETVPGDRGGDIITTEQYGDFELELEWKMTENEHGNSGIIYRLAETLDEAWQTGPEYQLLDDKSWGFELTAHNAAGALYDLGGPSKDKVLKPVSQWNLRRIRWYHGLLQHWLNGVKIVEVRTDGDDWKERIAKSKYKDYAGFGVLPKGYIGLQDYGRPVWFRNLKVRDLSAALPGEVRLFNGKDLTGWKPVLSDATPPEKVWSIRPDRPTAQPVTAPRLPDGDAGILVCNGQPVGYLRTEKDYTNYVLQFEWRFAQPGNSGALLRIIGPDKVWPRCVEAQLQHENAGDFWNIDQFPMKTDPARTEGRNTKKLRLAERPVGEWNEYEIVVDHAHITLKVNGDVLNQAWEVLETPGKIGLQSEGAAIEFRNIRLAPIP